MLEVDPKLLAARARRGLDRWDEMWDGELRMVPPASGTHQRFGSELLLVLAQRASDNGLELSYETGVFHRENDYRVPDLAVYRPDHQRARRGGCRAGRRDSLAG